MKIHIPDLRCRSLLAFCRQAVWDDLARPSVPIPGGRWGLRTLWILAVAVYFIGTLDLAQHYNLGFGPAMALTVARAAPVVLAPSRPGTAWWTELTAAVTTAALSRPHSSSEPWPWAVTSLLTVAVVFAVVGLRTSRRATFAMWLEALAAGALLVALVPTHDGWIALLPMSVFLAVAAVTADALRGRGEAQARLAAAEQISAAEQARATLLAERARIARELHDVVAHHMSVITVQADSAPYRIPDVPAAATEEFAAIATQARRSLTEMRRLLHVLRSEESPDGEHTPQPGLPDLPTLIETTSRAGIDTRLVVAEDVPTGAELPAAVGLSAYRLVQEALSNVVRHAPGARAHVKVDYAEGAVRIRVVNSGATGTRHSVETRAGGHGLVGMRERVAMLDGELTARALPDGGFHVTAILPLSGIS
ncbi:sensor histidine kinase [Actinacidiphila glaucinigra]|uniref:sensor histidine kinase n=1 Tax=Actinacidiphila glaucinigra TaxID=235986 RepID=UPI0033D4688B